MIYPSADEIDAQIDSKYALVILAAKRAKMIKEGASPRIKTDSANSLTVALEEIAAGAIKFRFDETSLAGQEALADKEAVVGSRDLSVEGLDPLALPDFDAVARATASLGGDLLGADDTDDDADVDPEAVEEEEEEESPLLMSDEDTEEPEA